MSNVIRLFPTTDIPTMLREMADRLDAGEAGDVRSMFAFTVDPDDEIVFYGWGADLSKREIIALLAMAKHDFLNFRIVDEDDD